MNTTFDKLKNGEKFYLKSKSNVNFKDSLLRIRITNIKEIFCLNEFKDKKEIYFYYDYVAQQWDKDGFYPCTIEN